MNMQSTGRLTTCQYARFLRREGIRTWTRAIKSVWSLELPAVKSSPRSKTKTKISPGSWLKTKTKSGPASTLPGEDPSSAGCFYVPVQDTSSDGCYKFWDSSPFLLIWKVPRQTECCPNFHWCQDSDSRRSCWSEKYQDKQNAAQIFIDVKTLIPDSTVWSESYQDGGNAARFYFDSKTLISVDKKVPRRRKCCPIFLRRRFNYLGSDIIRIG